MIGKQRGNFLTYLFFADEKHESGFGHYLSCNSFMKWKDITNACEQIQEHSAY